MFQSVVIDLGSCPEPVVETTNIMRVSWMRSDCVWPLSDNETGFCRTFHEKKTYQWVISNVGVLAFEVETTTTTCNFVGRLLSRAGFGGIEDGKGSTLVVLVHQTDGPVSFPTPNRDFSLASAYPAPIFRPSSSSFLSVTRSNLIARVVPAQSLIISILPMLSGAHRAR